MKRLAISLMLFAIAIGFADAIPLRQPSTPEAPKAPTPPKLDLRGTKWLGKDFVDNYHVTFESDGTLTYGYNKGSSRGGSWTFDGLNLYWEVNNKYREFKGTVTGGVLVGDSWNKTGKRWQTHMNRVK